MTLRQTVNEYAKFYDKLIKNKNILHKVVDHLVRFKQNGYIKPITTQPILLSPEFFPELCNQEITISKR